MFSQQRQSSAQLRTCSYFGQLEAATVEGMFQQLLDCGEHQVVLLVQEDLVAVTLLHFATSRAKGEKPCEFTALKVRQVLQVCVRTV